MVVTTAPVLPVGPNPAAHGLQGLLSNHGDEVRARVYGGGRNVGNALPTEDCYVAATATQGTRWKREVAHHRVGQPILTRNDLNGEATTPEICVKLVDGHGQEAGVGALKVAVNFSPFSTGTSSSRDWYV